MPRRVGVSVLGPLLVTVDGQPVEIGSRRQRRLLLALTVDGGGTRTADWLVECVWSDSDLPEDPRRALRTYVARLRKAVGGEQVIVTDPSGWRLDPGRIELDTERFERLLAEAEEPGRPLHDRIAVLDRARALWRGAAFEEVADEEWARVDAARLDELHIVAQERSFDAMLAAGLHTDVLPAVTQLVETNPLRDRPVGLQMLALFRTGRQAEALRAYQTHRQRLIDELGLEPGAELADLEQRIARGDETLLVTSPVGRALRGYRLGEQVGEGAFAVVYRGTQPSVGRDVAVKIIRSELANQPDFIRRFEAEAHLVARLEHPHIVPLYDYWREPDRACLVFRYLRGGSLEAKLTAGGGLAVDEVNRLVDQLASALTAAHAAGVVHRDVKPANVFLDDAGNYYLGDFGIALQDAELTDPSMALSAGSPAYASPEQLRREAIGPPADVHGLGITVYEALTGRLPFPAAITHAELLHHQLNDPIPGASQARADLPAAIDDVLARATAKDPAGRYQTVEAFTEDFAAALTPTGGAGSAPIRAGAATRRAGEGVDNPYKGLRAFTEADAAGFHGRERLVTRLVESLGRQGTEGRIAAVIGPSGIGKSSVVRAGLLPALRRGAVAGSDRWFVATMLPGADPFDELAAALLRIATRVPDHLASQLTDDRRGIARVVKSLIPEDGGAAGNGGEPPRSEVLLVIDQFEELFTLVDDDQRVRLFLESLEHALRDARCPLRVVLTMRADFWHRPLSYGSFARLIEGSTVNVTALAPDELERAITEPAAATGCEFEPGLVSEIAADVADQPGALPLLQYALTELWERQISGLLTRDAYLDLGGVAGALARRAEELYQESDGDERTTLRRIMGRLVTPGDGTADTRRRALRSELRLGPAADRLIDRWGEARLLSFDHDPATREPTVEVAHEALIRQWPRLREWLDEDRDGIRLHRHLQQAAAAWESSGRDDGELYRGGRLEAAEEFAATDPAALSEGEQTFVAAAVARRQADQDAETARFDQQRRANRRLRVLLSAVAGVATIAVIAGTLFFIERGHADDAARRASSEADRAEAEAAAAKAQADRADAEAANAETRRLVADAAALVEENRDIALLLAAEAYNRDPGPGTIAGLQRVLTRTGNHLGTIGSGETFLAGGHLADGTIVGVTAEAVKFYDPETSQPTREVMLDDAVPPSRFPYPPPARFVDDTAVVGTVAGTVLLIGPTDVQSIEVGPSAITGVAWEPSRGLVAASDADGLLHLIELGSGETRWSIEFAPESTYREIMGDEAWAALGDFAPFLGSAENIVFDLGLTYFEFEAGDSLLVSAGAYLRRFALDDGGTIGELLLEHSPGATPVFPRGAKEFVVDEDGDITVLAGSASIARIDAGLTAATWSEAAVGRVLTINTTSLAVSGGTIWTALDTGFLARGVRGQAGEAPPLNLGLAQASDLSVSPIDGSLLIVGDGGMVRWSPDGQQLLARAVPRAGNSGANVSADGRLLIATSGGEDVGSRFYELEGSESKLRNTTDPSAFNGYYGDGDPLNRWYVSEVPDRAELFDRETYRPIGQVFDGGVNVVYSKDGSLVAAEYRLEVQVFDTATWEPVSPRLDMSEWAPEFGDIRHITFDADAEHVVVSLLSGTTVAFSTASWEPEHIISPQDDGGALAAAFSADGSTFVTRSPGGGITIRDPETYGVVRTLEGGVSVGEYLANGPYLSHDGQYLLTVRETLPRLWHVPSNTVIGTFPHENGLSATGSDLGDELRLVSLLGEHALVWNLDVDSWAEIACRAAGRNLTAEEWKQFGPADEPYRSTCAQWPALD